MTRGTVLAAILVVLPACSSRPEAPPLTSEAVFQNEAVGLRFLAPAGWPVASRAVLPGGNLPRPIVLVAYQSAGTEKPATFEVLVADVSADADLGRFLVENPLGSEVWTPQPPALPLTINGASANRYAMTRTQGKEEFHREVTAFRRGARVYFFLVAYAASDVASRDTVRMTVASVTWTK